MNQQQISDIDTTSSSSHSNQSSNRETTNTSNNDTFVQQSTQRNSNATQYLSNESNRASYHNQQQNDNNDSLQGNVFSTQDEQTQQKQMGQEPEQQLLMEPSHREQSNMDSQKLESPIEQLVVHSNDNFNLKTDAFEQDNKVDNFIARYHTYFQVGTLGLLIAITIAVLGGAIGLIVNSSRINKDIASICETGFCYFVNVSEFQRSDDSGSSMGDFKGLKDALSRLLTYKVDTIIITDIDKFMNKIESEEMDVDIVGCIKHGFFLGITFHVLVNDFSDQNMLTNILKYNFVGLIQKSDTISVEDIRQARLIISTKRLPVQPVIGYMPTTMARLEEEEKKFDNKNFDFLILHRIDTSENNAIDGEFISTFKLVWKPDIFTIDSQVDEELTTNYNKNGLSVFSLSFIPDYVAFYAGQELKSPLANNFIKLYDDMSNTGDETYKMLKKNNEYRNYNHDFNCRNRKSRQKKIGPNLEVYLDDVDFNAKLDDCEQVKYSKLLTVQNPTENKVENLDLGSLVQDDQGKDIEIKAFFDYPLTASLYFPLLIDPHNFALDPYQGLTIVVLRQEGDNNDTTTPAAIVGATTAEATTTESTTTEATTAESANRNQQS